MRKDFVGDVSHELRTPLFLIKGYGQALQEGIAGREAVDIILDEAGRMQRLVDELLELTRLEAGAGSLNLEEIKIKEFLLNTGRKFEAVANNKGIALEYQIDAAVGSVTGDPDRLEQVMVNLLNNAVRHTPSGGRITLSAGKEENRVRIAVSDTGPGIPSEEMDLVWERFYRTDKGRSRKEGWAGLGLAIVRRIVEAHGGEVFLESELGRGSSFGFYLD
jgi:two-component system sensor histidine kinase ResE